MKQTVFRYGIYGTIAGLALGAIQFFILIPKLGYEGAELTGYLTILLSMVFVFLGIRYYRDRMNGGRLSFGEGMKLGVLIALVPAIFFSLFDLLYVEVINPGYMEAYQAQYVENLKQTSTPAELPAKLEKFEKQKEMFNNPLMMFLVMFATVFVIGVIVTIISALTLRNNKAVGAIA